MAPRSETTAEILLFGVRSAADAVAEVARLVAETDAPGWEFVPGGSVGIDLTVEGGSEPFPLVLPDGQVVGVVRCPSRPTDHPADAVLRVLLQVVVLLVATERRQGAAAGRAALAERESRLDALTGLPNRRAWDEAVAREQARCDRYGLQALVAIVDLDDLKEANDRHGHLAGDVVLRVTARALQSAVRGVDLVARLGGDEFAVLAVAWDSDHPGPGLPFPERLRTALAEAGVSASVGVALAEEGTKIVDAVARADAAMYEEKRARKGGRR